VMAARFWVNGVEYRLKYCEVCGKVLVPKLRKNGRLERGEEFAARRTCNRQCGSELRQMEGTARGGQLLEAEWLEGLEGDNG
jgi:RNase P subunit RPR2